MENNSLNLEEKTRFFEKAPILSHFKHLTTRFGLVQHTQNKHHDLRFGYSVDDQARALIVCLWYANLFGRSSVVDLIPIYLRYLADAQLPTGRFHNFRDSEGHFLDADGGDDAFGRSLWGLGVLLGQDQDFGLREAAALLFQKACSNLQPKKLWLRAVAYALLGAHAAHNESLARIFSKELVLRYRKNAQSDWQWFEDNLRYANGIIPYSLLMIDDPNATAIGLESLTFLNQASRVQGIPAPIGNHGWYVRGSTRAIFDQQCIDAADMVLANAAAFERTGDAVYWREVEDWFGWFLGQNTNQVTLITKDGGCYDGIGSADMNLNLGAESTLAYLLAHLTMARLVRLKSRWSHE